MVRDHVLQYVFPRGPDGKPDRATIDAALPEIRKVLGSLDRAIGPRDHLVGDSITLADILLAPMIVSVSATPDGKELIGSFPGRAPRRGETGRAAELCRGDASLPRRLNAGSSARNGKHEGGNAMTDHAVAIARGMAQARKALLAEEKEFTRARDALAPSAARCRGSRSTSSIGSRVQGAPLTLSDLFGPRRQLIVQHFMFAPEWEKPCKSCSFWADGYNGIVAHLAQRDTAFVAVSRAPLEKLEARRRKMGWTSPGYRPESPTSTTISRSRSATRSQSGDAPHTTISPSRGR